MAGMVSNVPVGMHTSKELLSSVKDLRRTTDPRTIKTRPHMTATTGRSHPIPSLQTWYGAAGARDSTMGLACRGMAITVLVDSHMLTLPHARTAPRAHPD